MQACCQRALSCVCVYKWVKRSLLWVGSNTQLSLTLGKAGRLTFANQLSQDSEVCAQTSKKVSSVNKDTKVYDVILKTTWCWIGLQTCVIVFIINHSVARLRVSTHEALVIYTSANIHKECSTHARNLI